jgi:hypothetical protein
LAFIAGSYVVELDSQRVKAAVHKSPLATTLLELAEWIRDAIMSCLNKVQLELEYRYVVYCTKKDALTVYL